MGNVVVYIGGSGVNDDGNGGGGDDRIGGRGREAHTKVQKHTRGMSFGW